MDPLEYLRSGLAQSELTSDRITKRLGPKRSLELRGLYFPNWKPAISMGTDIPLYSGHRVVHARDPYEGAVIEALAPTNVDLTIAIDGA
jgi:hypothetical protein